MLRLARIRLTDDAETLILVNTVNERFMLTGSHIVKSHL